MLIILCFPAFPNYLRAPNNDINLLFQRFAQFYNSGDLFNAEEIMFSVINSPETVTENYVVAAYNNLGAINILLGRYDNALEYNNKAEDKFKNKRQNPGTLADIYINRARIYTLQKSYNSAIDYFEKGIRIYNGIKDPDKTVFRNISSAYLNIGIAYYGIKDFRIAQNYFNRSAELRIKYNLAGIGFAYLNIAKTFGKTGNYMKAEEFYLKSISSFKIEFGNEYYRMAEVYFDYGLFLRSAGRSKEALEAHRKALFICLNNYGEKHTLVSLSYKHIGDHYINQNDYDSALFYYQKSLIAVVNDFNDPDIFKNPSIDSAIFDIRLLDNLKSKAQALEQLADHQNDSTVKLEIKRNSLVTIELAMQLIDRVRNNYLSEESRMYLTENEKETYIFAIHLAHSLFDLTNEESAAVEMYDIAKKAKAANLRNEISENELLYSMGIPDSLRKEQNNLLENIAAYNNLILEELRKRDPDNKKISLWKDVLFDINREREKLGSYINTEFPQYHDLLKQTETVTLIEIQKHLGKDETVIDYLLSNQYTDGLRRMYIFLVTKDRLEFRETVLDSLFLKNAEIIRSGDYLFQSRGKSADSFKNYTSSLYYMYNTLVKPVEKLFNGSRLIIIPDEEMAWLPFDAFLKKEPTPDQTDYEGLHYLIYDFTISYGYASSLIVRKELKLKGREKVYAFAPDYLNKAHHGKEPDHLQGAENEIDAILKLFRGKKFTGDNATETNFRDAMQKPAILHMAMHSLSDSTNSRYSFMMFDREKDNINDGKLYNYEISISRIKSPMVVLSVCNSGTGTLYHGEGLMSLARGFILAGASSVIKTSWEVNDEVSAAIIIRFYFHLSKGKPKDEAMRLAKLEYLKKSPPVFNNPYFWAAYEVTGENSPVVPRNRNNVLIIICVNLILAAGLFFTYFRR